jgi:hypothetical protein
MTKQFEKALVYATRIHGGQFRKKTRIPYIAHILGVTAIALEYGADETEAIGALLHDAVEDCGGLRACAISSGSSERQSPESWMVAPIRSRRRNHLGRSGKRNTSRISIKHRDRHGSFPPRTSSTTRGRSCVIFGKKATTCLPDSKAAKKEHFGIIVR